MEKTKCDGCGAACCKRVDIDTHEVHRCQYLTDDDQCSIYDRRPIACQLDDAFYSDAFREIHCQLAKGSINHEVPMVDLLKQYAQ